MEENSERRLEASTYAQEELEFEPLTLWFMGDC